MTSRGATLGFRVHSGWTMLVALGGPQRAPTVLLRRRVELTDPRAAGSSQPYHAARELDRAAAQALVEGAATTARSLAKEAVTGILRELKPTGVEVKACGLLMGAARPPEALEAILASHPMVHAAEGVLFRVAVADAARHARLPLTGVLERELLSTATKKLRLPPEDLARRLAELKKGVPPPWRQDEKYAALVAWLVLAEN